METFMNAAVLIEIMVMSFLLALWVTWIGLRGLFRLMPGGKLEAVPIRMVARQAGERAR